jgi:hypothetical protein
MVRSVAGDEGRRIGASLKGRQSGVGGQNAPELGSRSVPSYNPIIQPRGDERYDLDSS